MSVRNVFVGSSKEAKVARSASTLADRLSKALGREFKVTPWWAEEPWKTLDTPLTTLLEAIREFDYGVFLFWPDVRVTPSARESGASKRRVPRKKEVFATRDNVVLEFGMFLATLGKPRTFVIRPIISEGDFEVPSDLGDSSHAQLYQCSVQNDNVIAKKGAFERIASRLARAIKRDVRKRNTEAANSTLASTQLASTITEYAAQLDELEAVGASDTRMLNCADEHVKNFLAWKAAQNHKTVYETAKSLGAYFSLTDSILDIEQLSARQLRSSDNPIKEVWVLANRPLEYETSRRAALAAQFRKLRKTVVTNLAKGVKYRYVVSQDFKPKDIPISLRQSGLNEKHLGKVTVFKLHRASFETFYTVHVLDDRLDVYISAIMENREDLLIKASPEQGKRIWSRLESLVGCDDEQRGIWVRDFVHDSS